MGPVGERLMIIISFFYIAPFTKPEMLNRQELNATREKKTLKMFMHKLIISYLCEWGAIFGP